MILLCFNFAKVSIYIVKINTLNIKITTINSIINSNKKKKGSIITSLNLKQAFF